MPLRPEEERHVERLAAILRERSGRGARGLSEDALDELPRLYRFASSLLARLETGEREDETLARLRPLVFAAHGLLHRDLARPRSSRLERLIHFFFVECPRAIRAEWRLLVASLALLYGLAAMAWVLVAQDLSLAYSLLDPAVVTGEIEQLRGVEEGASFRGNFDFGIGHSPRVAGGIIGNNMQVSLLFFASALVPPLYLVIFVTNALMLGTYLGVAGHWEQAGSIASILWCHGTLELQAIVLAGTAGLVLLRGALASGPWSRAHALRRAGTQAWRLLAPVFPILLVAGSIEGYVSPHAPLGVRLTVAIATGAALLVWVLWSGRGAGGRSRHQTATS